MTAGSQNRYEVQIFVAIALNKDGKTLAIDLKNLHDSTRKNMIDKA